MAHLIDKDTLVAEIEKRIKEHHSGHLVCLKDMLSFLDSMEVKEVDLEKEIGNVWNPHFNLGWDDNSLVSINHKSFESIAKHFFELGLKAQKGE